MNDHSFDRLTRRASLAMLGGGALAALVSPLHAAAKNSKARNKKKNKNKGKTGPNSATLAKKKCQAQVGQCTNLLLSSQCLGDPVCLAKFQPCCSFAGQCDFTGFITCLQQTLAA